MCLICDDWNASRSTFSESCKALVKKRKVLSKEHKDEIIDMLNDWLFFWYDAPEPKTCQELQNKYKNL